MTATATQDQVSTVIFDRLRFLRDLAGSVDDQALRDDIDDVLNRALTAYCDRKRAALSAALHAQSVFVQKCA